MIPAMQLRLLKRMDWILALIVALLIGVGIAFIYSAAGAGNTHVFPGFYQRQLLWALIGFVFFIGFAAMDYHALINAAWWLYGAGIILLVMVLMPQLGHRIYGAQRWLQVAGFRLLQPSELMKLALIVLMAKLFGWPGRRADSRPLIFLALVLTIVPVLLIIRQPDMGTALIFVPILGAIMFAAGTPLRILGKFAAAIILMFSIVFGMLLLPQKLGWGEERQEKMLNTLRITPYQQERLLVFVDSNRDPLGAGWNKAQSQIAVGSGRFLGKGYLKGTQNILGFLPRTVAPNDFIFSIIAEEKGFAGSVFVLFLFAAVLGCGVRAAVVARDRVGMLLCVGVVALLFCHVFINVAMIIGLMPITGTPLPLVSYGGTFMVSVMSALGIVQSVYIRGEKRR